MSDLSVEKLMEVFESFDKNEDGYVDEHEAFQLFTSLGLDTTILETKLLTIFFLYL